MKLLSTQTPPDTRQLLTPTPVPQHSILYTLTLYYFFKATDAFPCKRKQREKLFSSLIETLNFLIAKLTTNTLEQKVSGISGSNLLLSCSLNLCN